MTKIEKLANSKMAEWMSPVTKQEITQFINKINEIIEIINKDSE